MKPFPVTVCASKCVQIVLPETSLPLFSINTQKTQALEMAALICTGCTAVMNQKALLSLT